MGRAVAQEFQGLGVLIGQDLEGDFAVAGGIIVNRITRWDGKNWSITSDWYESDDSVIGPMVKDAAAKYAAEKKITPGCLMTN